VITKKSLAAARGDSPITVNIILIDEMDKASDALQTLFLGVMERAKMKLGDGTDVDFSDCLIVFTANAGEDIYNKKNMGLKKESLKSDFRLRDALLKDFSSPFLNRINEFRLFASYTKDETHSALVIQADRMLESFGSFKSGIKISECFFDELLDVPTSKEFGMRDLVRKMKSIIRSRCLDVVLGVNKSKIITGDDVLAYMEAEREHGRRVQSAVS
jgi:ATP-dependent Clp protease ATP-binding subunit ClpA